MNSERNKNYENFRKVFTAIIVAKHKTMSRVSPQAKK